MVVWATSNNVLKDSGQPTPRSKTFAIPITVKSLKLNTIYSFFINGVNMNWACKPFGGTLGGNILSDNTGTVNFQFLHDQQHLQGLMATGTSNDILLSRLKAELRGPTNDSTFFYIPVHLKPTQ